MVGLEHNLSRCAVATAIVEAATEAGVLQEGKQRWSIEDFYIYPGA